MIRELARSLGYWSAHYLDQSRQDYWYGQYSKGRREAAVDLLRMLLRRASKPMRRQAAQRIKDSFIWCQTEVLKVRKAVAA